MPQVDPKRPARVLAVLTWSDRKFKVEYYDVHGNKYIEQFTASEYVNKFPQSVWF